MNEKEFGLLVFRAQKAFPFPHPSSQTLLFKAWKKEGKRKKEKNQIRGVYFFFFCSLSLYIYVHMIHMNNP